MITLRGFALLLLLQMCGEGLARLLSLPIPGPVIGMLLLWPMLQWTPLRDSLAAAAQLLLSHLSLFFVPAGVGVIAHLGLLSQYGLKLLWSSRCRPGSGWPSPRWCCARCWGRGTHE